MNFVRAAPVLQTSSSQKQPRPGGQGGNEILRWSIYHTKLTTFDILDPWVREN